MRPLFRPTLSFLSFLLLPFLVGGQSFPPRVSVFTPEEYEGHVQVYSGIPYANGLAAFGTSGMVFLYDGERFDRVMTESNSSVYSLLRTDSDRIYLSGVSMMGSIGVDSSGVWKYNSLTHLLPDSIGKLGNVWQCKKGSEGDIYFNSLDRIYRYDGDSLRCFDPERRFFLMHRVNGELVVQNWKKGLFRFSGDSLEYLSGSDSLLQGNKRVHAVLPDPEGKGWLIFTRKNGLFRYVPSSGEWMSYSDIEGKSNPAALQNTAVYSIESLSAEKNPFDARYAVGTLGKGVYFLRKDGSIAMHVGKDEGLPAKGVWDVFPDGKGNVWATTNSGIALIHSGLPYTFLEKEGHYDGVVQDLGRPSVKGSDEPAPLFMTTLQGAWYWGKKEERFLSFQKLRGKSSKELISIRTAKGNEKVIVAGGNGGCYAFPPRPKGSREGVELPVRPIDAVLRVASFPMKEGEGVIAGGRNGIMLLRPKEGGERWERLLTVQETDIGRGYMGSELGDDPEDSLDIWFLKGESQYVRVRVGRDWKGYRIARYDSTDGLPSEVGRVEKDEHGVLFITRDGPLRFQNGAFRPAPHYSRDIGMNWETLFYLEQGENGAIWANDQAGGRIKHLIPDNGGYRMDSLPFRGIDIGQVRAMHPEPKKVWMGGDDGLVRYYKEYERSYRDAWSCLIRRVEGSGDTLLFGGAFLDTSSFRRNEASFRPTWEQASHAVPELPFSKNRLQFFFAAPYPDGQERVRYSYRLSGFDTAWSDWAHKTRKEYTNLPEGSYTFKVKAKNVYLKESATARYRFRILPPWYRTWTAYGGYTLGGVAFIWLLLWLNGRRLMAQKQRLERIVRERTREIQEEKAKVEEQQKETEEQKREVERQKEQVEAAHERLSEAHQEITQSIDYAQKIQYALLQSEEHVSPHLPEHFILFKPQSQVSGDFYWAREHKGHLYIAAVDCTGHGVPGAFMSMLGISQLNEIMATDQLLTPGAILTELRDRVVRELSGSASGETAKDGMDAAMLRIPLKGEVGSGQSAVGSKESEGEEGIEVRFAGAQNPLYVVRKGIADDPPSVGSGDPVGATHGSPQHVSPDQRVKPFKKSSDGIEVKGDPMPVGYDEYAEGDFNTVSLQLQKGDMLYIFSDGYADQFGGPKGKKFRYAPFKKLLAELHERSMDEQKQELDRTFEDWKEKGQQEQIDDVVVIGIRV